MQKETFEVEYEYEGERLDKYVSILFPEQSRSFFQKLIKDGNVSVNDKVQKANYRLKTEDLVTVEIPDAVETQILPEDIPLDILYEDDDLLVVNKPKGMVVHPSAGHYSGTLVNAIMYHCKDSLSGINGEIRPGIVHRIDMDTTGSLIVCKNDESHVFIAEQIKEHSVNRRYRGIVYGVVRDDEGTIHAPIGRHPVDRKKMAINEKNGKDAITHYKVLERFDKYTYMEFKLETGRTHQIRVHMASIGHPLLGDTLYSNGKSPYKLQGQTLHAMTIGFIPYDLSFYLVAVLIYSIFLILFLVLRLDLQTLGQSQIFAVQILEEDIIIHLLTELVILQAAELDEGTDVIPVFVVLFLIRLAHTGQLVRYLLGNVLGDLLDKSIILQCTSGYVQRQIRAVDDTL